MIQKANKDANFSNIINNAEMVVPDGIGVQLGLKILGHRVKRIAGVDLGEALLLVGRNKPCIANLLDIDEYPFWEDVSEITDTNAEEQNEEYDKERAVYLQRNGETKEKSQISLLNAKNLESAKKHSKLVELTVFSKTKT